MSQGSGAVRLAAHGSAEVRLQQAMVALLLVFLFTLPLLEAPKNIVAGLFLAVWAVRAALTRDLGGPWTAVDTAFGLMLASAFASGLAGYAGDLRGVTRVVLFSWVVSRSGIGPRSLRPLRAAACLGLALAIPFGLVPFLAEKKEFFELPSVGHVNQSALYLAILAAAALGWWLQGGESGPRGRTRWALGACATLFSATLLVSASR
ncbi:MAG TPA: hypothetical protein VFM98_17235, partial [Ramlibacter sp.]|uniref:hypothetical protein n=1 Tax=Ramlibacter sp. TaxID=1917967 RepID=UPI002D7F4244